MIINKKPKFFWLLKLFFHAADWDKGVIITFKPWIFCKVELSASDIAHEETHLRQQTNVYWWWIKYTLSSKFRLSQEIEAHQNEYRTIERITPHRKALESYRLSERLSSKLYGNLITREEAVGIIKQ